MGTPAVTALFVILAAGASAVAFLLFTRRMRLQHQLDVDGYEAEIADLRQERADDREVNRRLRRELAINTPAALESTREERDEAIDELGKLSAELLRTSNELTDRDRSLREARLAIHDIRVQLERDRFAGEGSSDGARLSVDEVLAMASEAEAATNGEFDDRPLGEPTAT